MGAFVAIGKIILTVYSIVKAIIEVINIQMIANTVTIMCQSVHIVIDGLIEIVNMTMIALGDKILTATQAIAEITVKTGKAFTNMVEYMNRVWNGLKAGYDELLVAIHFETLKKIHNISLMISSDYRKIYKDFWNSISKLSTALQMTNVGLPLLLRITQQSQQMFSSMVGVGYDIGNLQWMKSISNWDGWGAIKSGVNPPSFGEILDWIDSVGDTDVYVHEKLEKPRPPDLIFTKIWKAFNLGMSEPIFDGSANVSKVNYGVTEGIIDTTDLLLKQYMALDQSVSKLEKAVPPDWADAIAAATGGVRGNINTFIADIYTPTMAKLNTAIDYLKDGLKTLSGRANDNADKISRPGEMMQKIDKLSDIERKIEEDKISQAASRSEMREVEPINIEIYAHQENIRQAFEEDILTTPPPPLLGLEKEGVKPKPPGTVKPGEGWYVGDF